MRRDLQQRPLRLIPPIIVTIITTRFSQQDSYHEGIYGRRRSKSKHKWPKTVLSEKKMRIWDSHGKDKDGSGEGACVSERSCHRANGIMRRHQTQGLSANICEKVKILRPELDIRQTLAITQCTFISTFLERGSSLLVTVYVCFLLSWHLSLNSSESYLLSL